MFIDKLSPTTTGICETWLRLSLNFRFRGYETFQEDRFPQTEGGLAIMVKDDIPSRSFSLNYYHNGILEVTAIRVGLPGRWITILVMYNPCHNVTHDELLHYTDQLPSPALVVGDFNARHGLWEPDLPAISHSPSGSFTFAFLLNSPRFTLSLLQAFTLVLTFILELLLPWTCVLVTHTFIMQNLS